MVDASDPADIQLLFRADVATPKEGNRAFYQWFYFRASNVRGVPCVFNLMNAGGSLNSRSGWTPALDEDYPKTVETNAAHIGYTARASYDRKSWSLSLSLSLSLSFSLSLSQTIHVCV